METTIVGDSALYSKDNLGLLKQIKWLTRVPLSIKEAKKLVTEVSSSEFSKSELSGYSFVEKTSNYGRINQRWLVVESEAKAESDKKSLERKITKEKEIIQKKVAKLFKKTFDNATEAELSLRQLKSKLKYHLISEIEIIVLNVNYFVRPTRCAMRFKLLRQGWVGDGDRRLELSRRILPSLGFGRSDKHSVR